MLVGYEGAKISATIITTTEEVDTKEYDLYSWDIEHEGGPEDSKKDIQNTVINVSFSTKGKEMWKCLSCSTG